MTKPNLPASAGDAARLISRVEQLERQFRNVGLAAQEGAATGIASQSWADLYGAGLTGLVSDTPHNLLPAGTSAISGTDIQEGSGIYLGHINTDGVYSFTAGLRVIATTAGDTFHTAFFSVGVLETTGHPTPTLQDIKGAGLLSSKHQANTTISWAGFLGAGTNINVQATFTGGGGGTWEFDGHLLISRLV